MTSFPPQVVMKLVLLILVILAAWVLHPFIWQLFINSKEIKGSTQKIQIVAHRGANKVAPENTLSAFKKALAFGADMIEIDVHLTKDHQLIVIHDEELNRTTNGTGNVSDYTLAELRKFDTGSWFSKEFKGEQLPTLSETLELINGKAIC